MALYLPSEYSSSKLIYKPHLQSGMTPLSPSGSVMTYFDKFEKNYQTSANNRNINNFVTEIKGNLQQATRGKSLSQCYQPKRAQTYKIYGTEIKENQLGHQDKSADRYKPEKSIERYAEKYLNDHKENEYISVEKLLQKEPKPKDSKLIESTDKNPLRPKSSKSCSTHQLATTQKFNSYESFLSPTYKSIHREKSQHVCPNTEKEKKFHNIYSQSNFTQREKANKISVLMKKIEGIQRNFNEHLFYKSIDYTTRIPERPEPSQLDTKSQIVLKEAKNTENTPPMPVSSKTPKMMTYKKSNSCCQEELRVLKAKTFFEKENDSFLEKSQTFTKDFTKINEKLYSQIVSKRLDPHERIQEKKEGIQTRSTPSVKFALFMPPDAPSHPCTTIEAMKIDKNKPPTSQSSFIFANQPTKFDRGSLKVVSIKSPKAKTPTSRIISLNPSFSIEDFQIGKCLGKGRFGSVFLAKDKRSDALVALKVVKKKTIKDSKMANQIKNEIKIQSCLSHPNILRLYGFFQDEEQFYLILEYAPHGELYKKMKKQVSLLKSCIVKWGL